MIQSSDSTTNTGYDYGTNGLTNKFFSSLILNNSRLSEFITYIDTILIEVTESVKKFQFYTNFTIDKNDRRLNT